MSATPGRPVLAEHVVHDSARETGLFGSDAEARRLAHDLVAGFPDDSALKGTWSGNRGQATFHATGEDGASLRRVFSPRRDGSWSVEHAHFSVPGEKRGRGGADRMLAASLDAYQRHDVSRITLMAGLEAGGYVWARAGFAPNDPDAMRRAIAGLGERARRSGNVAAAQEFETVARASGDRALMHDLARVRTDQYPDLGKRALKGVDWSGHLDLRNPEDVARVRKAIGHG